MAERIIYTNIILDLEVNYIDYYSVIISLENTVQKAKKC